MDWVEGLNQSVRYIEEHLTDEIDSEQLGRIACCSTYHYQRMFTYMAGISLAEYIRRRKMSLAAVELQDGKKRIIDVAAKYGYSSPTAFNRAFQSFHGIAPSSLKNTDALVKSFSPIAFYITVKGATEMNYRIETKGAFRIIGVSAPLDREMEKNFMVVPKPPQMERYKSWQVGWTRHPLDFWESAPAMMKSSGNILLLFQAQRKMGNLRSISYPHPHGPSSPQQVITSLFKSWNDALLQSGFRVPDMNMPMLRI